MATVSTATRIKCSGNSSVAIILIRVLHHHDFCSPLTLNLHCLEKRVCTQNIILHSAQIADCICILWRLLDVKDFMPKKR